MAWACWTMRNLNLIHDSPEYVPEHTNALYCRSTRLGHVDMWIEHPNPMSNTEKPNGTESMKTKNEKGKGKSNKRK